MEQRAELTAEPLSFDAVYASKREDMVRLAYLLTGNRAVAEDVVQDAFVGLHRRWRGVEHPVAYLRVAVVNGCRAHHRRTRLERSRFADLVTLSVSDEAQVLVDAIGRLPYRQQVALVLRFYEDRPEAEIADLLGCRPATVRSLVRRGLVALRKVIDHD